MSQVSINEVFCNDFLLTYQEHTMKIDLHLIYISYIFRFVIEIYICLYLEVQIICWFYTNEIALLLLIVAISTIILLILTYINLY